MLDSVCESEGSFTMVELGAGWGRWIVNAAVALRQIDPERPFLLVGVEAEPTHFEWLRRHLLDNGIDPDRHTLVRAAVAPTEGRVKFQRGDAAGWYGQSIERDDPAAKLSGPVSRLIRWTRNGVANRLAVGSERARSGARARSRSPRSSSRWSSSTSSTQTCRAPRRSCWSLPPTSSSRRCDASTSARTARRTSCVCARCSSGSDGAAGSTTRGRRGTTRRSGP